MVDVLHQNASQQSWRLPDALAGNGRHAEKCRCTPPTHMHEFQEDSVHDSLAVAVANEVLSDPDTTDVRLYCRSLSTMELTPTNQVHIHGSAAFIINPNLRKPL